MFIIGQFLVALGSIIQVVLWTYKIFVIAAVLISWVSPDPYNPIVRFLNSATEPLLGPIRKKLPPMSGLDFSPIVLLLAIMFLEIFIPSVLVHTGQSLQAGN